MDPKLIFRRVCKSLDDRKWKYDTDEEKLVVYLSVNGEDIPVRLIFVVDDKREMLKLLSPMPFDISEDKRVEAAVAVCAINNQLVNGNFDLDVSDGTISFRVAVPFKGGLPDEAIDYLIGVTCVTADEYNDKLLMFNKGLINLEKFLQEL